jgi:hypothetical protein
MTVRTPLWYRGRATPDFLTDERRGCVGKRDLYFDESIEALAACQAICVICPVFQACTRWAMAQHREGNLEFGIFAGLTPHVRDKIVDGKTHYYDWRREWNRRHYVSRIAAQSSRAAYKAGRGKRAQAKAEMPLCRFCGQQDRVCRYGRDRGHQRYRCYACRASFLGEEML